MSLRYIKFKAGTKERCLQALDHLNQNESFIYLRENMLDETTNDATRLYVDTHAREDEHAPLQGVARVFKELCDLSRDAFKLRKHQNKG